MTASPLEMSTIPGYGTFECEQWNWTAADVANGNYVPYTGREVLMARNVSEDSGGNFTVVALDPVDDIDTFMTFGVSIAIPFLRLSKYQQSNRTVLLSCDSAEIEFAVLRLPT